MKKSKRTIMSVLVIIFITTILTSCATQHHKCGAYGSNYGDSHRKQGVVVCRSW